MNMRHTRVLLTCLIALTGINMAFGALDTKFYNKIAEKVWNTTDTMFNARKYVPENLIEGNSAVILAWDDNFDVDHIINTTIYKQSGQTNRLKKEHISRKMVKLLDQSAIDYFSDMEFGEQKEIKYRGFVIYSLKEAFGARIHKPSGEIVTVDLSQAIETGSGKKGKDNRYYKLAIPGLEPGDVLDYFTYSEELCEMYDLDPQDIMIATTYPVISRRVSIASQPDVTVEYKCYNGVPALNRNADTKDRKSASLHLGNIPGVNFKRYTMPLRQIPFIRFRFINNNDRSVMARSARSGGLYGNIHTGKIMSEFGDYLKDVTYDSPLVGRSVKLVKDSYLKSKPDATPRQTADAAYMAVFYNDFTAKNESDRTSGQFERALIFNDVVKKLNIYPEDSLAIGLVNPRSDVPIDEVSAWKEGRFVVKTPDALYYIPINLAIAPGEVPGRFKGEKALLYYGDRKAITPRTLLGEYVIPGKRLTDNSLVTNDTLYIDGDELVRMNSQLTFTGGIKSEMSDFTEPFEWIAEVEDFFAIPENKRYKDKSYDAVGRDKENRDDFTEAFESLYGTKPENMTKAEFKSRGVRPDNSEMVVVTDAEFKGLVEPLGNELSLSIGKLAGMPSPITDNERRRLLDVMLPCVSQEVHNIVVKKPAGYKFDEASVEAIARNVVEIPGQFFVQPKINEDGDLEITVVMREKFADVPLDHWDKFMHLIDEEARFADASVILVKE